MPDAIAVPKPMSAADWAQLFVLGALWGGSFFFVRIAVAEIDPLTLVLFRVGIAAIALHLFSALRGLSFRPAVARAIPFFVLAVLNNIIPFSLIFAGETKIGAGLAAILNATTPFCTVIAANALTSDEKFTWNKIAGVLLGMAGTAVLIGPGALAGLGGPLWAKLAMIGAAASYALAVIFAKRFRGMPPTTVATAQMTASTVIMIVLVPLLHGTSNLVAASAGAWAATAALGILSTAVAYILYFNLIPSAGATNASLVTLVAPVGAVVLGVLFLGEQLQLHEMTGMLLIGLGLVTIDGRLLARR